MIFENERTSAPTSSATCAAPVLEQMGRTRREDHPLYGITHPSQPNYLSPFSGTTHGVSRNARRAAGSRRKQNLASELRRAGLSFTGYAEALR